MCSCKHVFNRAGRVYAAQPFRFVIAQTGVGALYAALIGRALGLEEGTVKSRIFRARKKLSEFLIREGNIPGSLASNERKGGANA